MSTNKFTDEFKRDAAAQVVDRGYPVREVAERLGISTKSIYTWQRLFSRPTKVVPFTVDLHENLVKMPLPIRMIARLVTSSSRNL